MHPLNETSDIDDSNSDSRERSKTSGRRGRRSPKDRAGLALTIEPEHLGICRLPPKTRIPIWVHRSQFYTVSRSRDELSIVCEQELVPKSVHCEAGWRAIKVKEPLDPSLVGVLASLANPLTKAGVSIFSISTYDTDYLLVREKKLDHAQRVLEAAGHRFQEDHGDDKRPFTLTRGVEAPTPSEAAAAEETAAKEAPPEDSAAEDDKPARDASARSKRGGRSKTSKRKSPPGRVVAKEEEPSSRDDTSEVTERPPRKRRQRGAARATAKAAAARDAESPSATTEESKSASTTASQKAASQKASSQTTAPTESPSDEAESDAASPSTVSPKAEAVATGDVGPQGTESTPEDEADPSAALLNHSTRRRSVRSEERRQRLSRALRQFGAALTNDPRFAETTPEESPQASPEAETGANAEQAEDAAPTSTDAAASTEASPDAQTAVKTDAAADTETDELDLDWEGELVEGAPPASESGAEPARGAVSKDATSKTAAPKDVTSKDATSKKAASVGSTSSPSTFHAASSGAFQGESLTSRSEEDDKDEDVEAEGLFTGAIPQNDVEVTDQSFATLGLSDPVLEAVRQMGFENPTPIQAAVVPEALEGADIIGLAETGSGKTAAFVLPLADRLYHGKGIRGLIICPTREIALQTKAFIDTFGKHHKLRAVAVIGGVKMGPQIDRLRSRPDIVVATPGRLADHLRRGNVDLSRLEELVIDEADHMLDLGFLPQIKEILEQVPKERRSMMFSATMLPAIERLAQQFMNDPLTIDIRPVNQVAEGIEHRLYLVHDADLKTCLLRLLDEVPGSTLIFARRKLHTEWLARQLQQAGCPADRIHSDRTQAQRVRALRGFREGKFRILVATDVAARGIDVPRIQHVINYGLPEAVEDYVHRAGRTARGNSVGVVSSIGTWQDKPFVREIESTLGVEMPRCSVEGVDAYVERRPRRKTVRRRRLL